VVNVWACEIRAVQQVMNNRMNMKFFWEFLGKNAA
jgi:hypothetical protein